MNKLLLLLTLYCLTLPACTETRVIRDYSIESKFMWMDGVQGARVQQGDGSAQAKLREQQRAKLAASKTNTHNPASNPFGNATWTTTFQVDPNATNGATVNTSTPSPPQGGIQLIGGIILPPPPTTQPAKQP